MSTSFNLPRLIHVAEVLSPRDRYVLRFNELEGPRIGDIFPPVVEWNNIPPRRTENFLPLCHFGKFFSCNPFQDAPRFSIIDSSAVMALNFVLIRSSAVRFPKSLSNFFCVCGVKFNLIGKGEHNGTNRFVTEQTRTASNGQNR